MGDPAGSQWATLGGSVSPTPVAQYRVTADTLRLTRQVLALPTLARQLTGQEGIAEAALRSGRRTRALVRARRLFCQLAVRGMGYSGAEVARFLGVTTSAVNRLAVAEELPEVRKYLKAL